MGGSSSIDGPCPEQLAEVIVQGIDGTPRRGSGYRVSETVVLTAAHVVEDAVSVKVRFEADRDGEWVCAAQDVVRDPRADLAALVLDADGLQGADREVQPPRYGWIGDRAAVISAVAVGFPRFKLRDYSSPGGLGASFRDSHQVDASIAVLSNRRENTIEVTVAPPERDPDALVSPWEGMSGAGLWAAGCLVGVVTAHHRSDGLGRLAATRLDSATPGERFSALVGLPPDLSVLPDVLPRPVSSLVTTAYRLQIADIAPPDLRDRAEEVAQLARFCSGPDSYAWWQAGPWAGKTALMAWFSLHPPEGVDVVSFFVAGALAGQSDSEAFLEACAEQLTVLARRPLGAPATTAARHGRLLELLHAAAAQSRAARRRILLVVDGLDEDNGPGTRKQSIASLLPRRPIPGVHVLVTSRPDPILPTDVPSDHPLRACAKINLAPAEVAHVEQTFARRELELQLQGGAVPELVLGLVAASGGGLSRQDLVELAEVPDRTLGELLNGVLGQSLRARTQRLPGSGEEGTSRGYLFAHDTLRALATSEFGPRLSAFRNRLHAWADRYRERGWPPETPRYLLRDYVRMLAASEETGRLMALASDPRRHARMLAVTGGDALALDEMALAQSAGTSRRPADLRALTALALRREELVRSNEAVPVALPAVWALIGEASRAESLARSAVGESRQGEAFSRAALAAARAGHVADAETLIQGIEDLGRRDQTVVSVATELLAADPPAAVRVAGALLTDESTRSTTLDRLEAATAERVDVFIRDDAATTEPSELALYLAKQGRGEEVLRLLPRVINDRADAEARLRLVEPLTRTGANNTARKIAEELRAPDLRVSAFVEMLIAGGPVQPLTDALLVAAGEVAGDRVCTTLLDAAQELVDGSDPSSAARVARCAEERLDPDRHQDGEGHPPSRPLEVLGLRAVARACVGDWKAAIDLLRSIEPRRRRVPARQVAAVAERRGEEDLAMTLAAEMPSVVDHAETLAVLARTAAERGHRDRAVALAANAERVARDTGDPRQLLAAADGVIDGLIAAGRTNDAVDIARRALEDERLAAAQMRIAARLVEDHRTDEATSLVLSLSAYAQAETRTLLADHRARHELWGDALGDIEAALHLIDDVDDGLGRCLLLTRLARTRALVELGLAGGSGDGTPPPAGSAPVLAERAQREAAALTNTERRARALGIVAAAAPAIAGPGAHGLQRRADDELESLSARSLDRSRAWLAVALARDGHLAAARAHARQVCATAARVRVACTLAAAPGTAASEAHELVHEASSLAWLLEASDERAAALAQVLDAATALADRELPANTELVVRPLAELLAGDWWTRAAPSLARVDWDAFTIILSWVEKHIGGDKSGYATLSDDYGSE